MIARPIGAWTSPPWPSPSASVAMPHPPAMNAPVARFQPQDPQFAARQLIADAEMRARTECQMIAAVGPRRVERVGPGKLAGTEPLPALRPHRLEQRLTVRLRCLWCR